MVYIKIIILSVLSAFFLFSTAVFADISTPTVTNVYFTVDGEPYDDPLEYTVTCYGYSYPPGEPPQVESYTPEKVFSYHASCPEYGCKIYEDYYLNYRHIDYCDMEVVTADKVFTLDQYANSPVPECESVHQWDISNADGYHRTTEGYWDCVRGDSDRSICDDLFTEKISESELVMDPRGDAVDRICESRVDFAGYVEATVHDLVDKDESDRKWLPYGILGVLVLLLLVVILKKRYNAV